MSLVYPDVMADVNGALLGHDGMQAEMMEERCILVDTNDTSVGSESKLACHYGDGLLHRAFSVLIFDSEDRLLVQQRSREKITFPGIWANTCCSHPLDIEGENDDTVQGCINAAIRKLPQELGISNEVANSLIFKHIGSFQYKCRWNDDWVENEVDHVLVARVDSMEVSPNENEISQKGNCSWMEVECLGACVNAPMMQINDDYYEDLDKEKTLKILDKILNGETPKPGSYRGRTNNEPENNRKTLMDLKNA